MTRIAGRAPGSARRRGVVTAPVTNMRLTRNASTGMIQRNGVNFRTGGTNIFQIINNDYPSSDGRLMSNDEINSLLDKMSPLKIGIARAHTLGVNIGDKASQLVSGVTGTTTPVISYRSAVWERMDYAIYAAGLRGLYFMVPMTDELGYYHGGKRQWVNFRRPGTCSTDGNVKSANSATERAAEDYFYSDAQIKLDFKTYISDWLNHVNQYTGIAYKNDPTIAVIETGNELWTADSFRSWTPEIAAYIKSVAPNVLVADGMAADGSSYWSDNGGDSLEHIMTTEALNSSAIDIMGIHPYSVFTSNDVSTGAARAAAKGKAFATGEYAWSKNTANAVEQATLGAANGFFSAFWSLQNDADAHNGGSGANYGSDDASFYYPGRDSTQNAAVSRIQALGQAYADAAAGGGTPVTPAPSGDITDTFAGTNGTAPDSAKWIVSNTSGSTTTIQNNAVALTTGTQGGYGDKATLISKSSAYTDQRIVFDFTPSSVAEAYFQISIKASTRDSSIGDVSAFRVEVSCDAGYISLQQRGGSGAGVIAGGGGLAIPGWAAGVQVHCDFSIIGSTIRVYFWTGGTKPSTPTMQATNSNITAAGYNGFVLNGGNTTPSRTITIDNYALTSV